MRTQRRWWAEHARPWSVFVADRAGDVVGWASLSRWSDRPGYRRTGEVSIYVRSDARGRGVGRALIEQLVASGAQAGLHTLLARIADGNAASVRLHTRQGFVLVGVLHEVGYKFDRWIDVQMLQRMYPPTPHDGLARRARRVSRMRRRSPSE